MYNYDISRMNDRVIRKFIDDADKASDPDRSAVTKANMMFLMQLRAVILDYNFFMAQLITIQLILSKISRKDFHYLICNTSRIVKSLLTQRNLFSMMRNAASSMVVDPSTKSAFSYMINRANSRCKYLRETVIPDNLSLTPIKEYIEIVGDDSFLSAISKFAKDTKGLLDFQNSGGLDMFADDILETVNKAGKGDVFRERISAYNNKRVQQDSSVKTEEFERKSKEKEELAYAGMRKFHSLLNRAIHSRQSCVEIGFMPTNIGRTISKLMNTYIILRCSVNNAGAYCFHYITRAENVTYNFAQARKFLTFNEAEDCVNRLSSMHANRGKCFSVYQIGI